jgi:hypothetical protein
LYVFLRICAIRMDLKVKSDIYVWYNQLTLQKRKIRFGLPKKTDLLHLNLYLSFSPNFKFIICQSSIDLDKSELKITASLTDFKFKIR